MATSHSFVRRLSAAALACAALQMVFADAPTSRAVAAAGADGLFDPNELHDIWIHINARDWDQLRSAYQENTYYPADIEWRGVKVRNVGIRVRGRTSRNPRKPGLQIDFNRYVTGQEFLGLKSLVLDNLWQDPSMIRERLAMLVFQRMGIAAPRESHARIYVGGDRAFAGVYGVVESVDKDFLKRHLGENSGYLYEYHWQEPFGFEVTPPTLEWYAARFEPRTHETAAPVTLFSPISTLVQAINDAPSAYVEEDLAPYLNVRRYIRHIAIENVLSQPDGLLGGLGMNNFYLYRSEATLRFELIPWDQDLAFEQLEAPPPWHNFAANVLATKIWAAPELRDVYLRALVDIADSIGIPSATGLTAAPSECRPTAAEASCGWLEEEIVREHMLIRSAALADPRSPYSGEEFEAAVDFLRRFARERGAIVRDYVAGFAPEMAVPSSKGLSGTSRYRSRQLPTPR
jgi:CotH protein